MIAGETTGLYTSPTGNNAVLESLTKENSKVKAPIRVSLAMQEF
jgi:hypothetical protein